MTVSDATYPVWTSAQLDYRALITYLSQHAGYPCSIFLRNHLLAPYTANIAHPAVCKDVAVDDDPWRTWHDYRRGATVAAIGAVPDGVLNKPIDKSSDVDEDDTTEEPLWALVTVAPSYAPGWVKPLADEAGQNSMRFNLWLSSERTLSSGSREVPRASDEEVGLLRFICRQYLPTCVARLAAAVPASLQHVSTEDDRAMVTIFAIHHSWVEAMQERLYDDGDDGPNAAQKDVQCVRDNSCTTFVMGEERAHAMAAEVLQRAKSTQWHVTPIDKSEATEKVILESNGIAFPTWYLRNRRHLSALVRDGRPLNEGSVSYPSQRQAGAAAGWAYAHDECAVASLHVTEPYRRLTRTSNNSNAVGVGQLCVAHMTDQLIAAQKRALAKVGLESLPTPLFSSAESHKAAAVGFHEKMGFTPSVPSTWGALAVRLPRSL